MHVYEFGLMRVPIESLPVTWARGWQPLQTWLALGYEDPLYTDIPTTDGAFRMEEARAQSPSLTKLAIGPFMKQAPPAERNASPTAPKAPTPKAMTIVTRHDGSAYIVEDSAPVSYVP
jgi:hypothetical protein